MGMSPIQLRMVTKPPHVRQLLVEFDRRLACVGKAGCAPFGRFDSLRGVVSGAVANVTDSTVARRRLLYRKKLGNGVRARRVGACDKVLRAAPPINVATTTPTSSAGARPGR